MVKKHGIRRIASAFAVGCSLLAGVPAHGMPKNNIGSTHLKVYNAPGFYTFHTDVSLKTLRQIWLRMNFVAEAYQHRLHAIFGGAVTQKLPFYIFKNAHEYYADGGMPGSAGVFEYNYSGQWLMAICGRHMNHQRWHIIQHEGFHQFTFAFIHRFLPAWANEGTAEFFGEGLFTGSSFVTGWIPPYREAAIKYEIKHNKFKTIHAMRKMSYNKWNDVLMGTNYDEAQRLYVKYWLNLPPNATAELYTRVQTTTLTNFLARAYTLKQRFYSARHFLHAAGDGTLKVYHFPNRLWLPPDLLSHALHESTRVGTWAIDSSELPKLICTMPDGTRLIGSFRIADGRPVDVRVKVVKAKKKQSPSNYLESVAH